MLIERIEPGNLLLSLPDDDEATKIAISVMQKLHKPIEDNSAFPTVAMWLMGFKRLYKRFDGDTGPFPKKIIARADQLSQELLQSSGKNVLLHGDLHHYNILFSKHDSWLAIDPKGVIGEAEYEIGALMKNPMPRLMASKNLNNLFSRRIDIITEMTGFDRQRITSWSFLNAVLSAWWTFESGSSDIKPLLICAEALIGNI